MRTETSPTIHRADYEPLAWQIDTVSLHFRLAAEGTRVTSILACRRAPDVARAPLCLFGEDLELVSLRVDGQPADDRDITHTDDGLLLDLAGDNAVVEVVTQIDPVANTSLSGLYLSKGGFFTQCEAQGFRRITYFPDRPDVMARFTVTLEADRARYPVLLSNGNLVEQGELEDGWHFARWDDPFPKPSYLFALVAADLVSLEKRIETVSGREVLLQVWVEEGNLDRAGHAMDSLVHALRWDEETFGLELDLDRFMIVAVADFNMGAMENKGLNIFNTRFVLARPDTATDADYEGIESVVAHEYFHNWTGNRVTCRDWFQLTLKEGLTVFRDQQFSADMLARAAGAEGADSARAVKRVDDVRALRSAQFTEDSGPMSHPIRPDSYQEINNFYTATVYEKGAEVIRMLHTLLGAEGFRKGMDLYFERHDGQAVTCDDFVASMADANDRDLTRFMRWYGQAGTPVVTARGKWIPGGRFELTLAQHTPPTPGQPEKLPLVIPVAVGLIGPDGNDMPLRLDGEAGGGLETRILELVEAEQTFVFTDLPAEPVPSLLRGCSAPVILDIEEDDSRLAFRMAHDSDAFNRWDAAQRFTERVILGIADGSETDASPLPDDYLRAFRALITDETLDPAFRVLAASLPGETYLLDRMTQADPQALRRAMIRVMSCIGAEFGEEWLSLYKAMEVPGAYRYHPADAGQRALRNLALRYLAAAGNPDGLARAETQFEYASNMTEQIGALVALINTAAPAATMNALENFYTRFSGDALVIDKWFALQASAWRWDASGAPVLERVRTLMDDPAFKLTNPNKVYSLLGTFFRGNPGEFHQPDGSGYAFWADQVIALDRANPQIASRMARALENWRHYTPELQERIRVELERVRNVDGLSPDVREIVDKALAD